MDILHDLRVIDLSSGIGGSYASKLLADAGADVIKVEPAAGDPFRQGPEGQASDRTTGTPLFRYLNASKRSLVGTASDQHVIELIADADLVVESCTPRVLDIDAWLQRAPHLVILSVTPYGRTGPWEQRAATEFVVQAEAGSIGIRGRKDGVPYPAGGQLSEWLAGLFGAVGAMAAVRGARETGVGEHVDASWLCAINFAAASQARAKFQTQRHPPLAQPYRVMEAPSIEPTIDGYIGFNTNTRTQFDNFLVMIDRSDLLADERWASGPYRSEHLDEWNAIVRAWTRRHTTAEIAEIASQFRIPVAPVNSGATVLEHEQFVARRSFTPAPDDSMLQPDGPYRLNGERPRPRTPSPTVGQHRDEVRPRRPQAVQVPSARRLPFEGLRVLDATAWWAGPSAGQVFASLGADVIHLESVQRLDSMRTFVGPVGTSSEWWECSALFLATNVNKRGLTIDLGQARGRQIVSKLIGQCDVVLENFAPRVFDEFGFDAASVRQLNPEAVYVRMPAFGLDGPWRDNVGFAQTMEQMTGQAWMTGHPSDPPAIPRGPADPLAGFQAAFAALVGLHRRDLVGEGCVIEATMAEAVLAASAEPILEFTANGIVMERTGNRSPVSAPQGLYPCRGDDQWLALSIVNDAQWRSFRQVLGDPGWARDDSLRYVSGRMQAHDLLDELIAEWAADRDVDVLVAALLDADIPAGRFRDPRMVHGHPQLDALGYFETVEHPVAGASDIAVLPFQFRSVERWTRRRAPLLGEHNTEILRDVLGLTEEEIASLETDAVIGRKPLHL